MSLIVLFFCLTIAGVTEAAGAEKTTCDRQFVQIGEKNYSIVYENQADFAAAYETCGKIDSLPAAFETPVELLAIDWYFKSIVPSEDVTQYIIGLIRANDEWMWIEPAALRSIQPLIWPSEIFKTAFSNSASKSYATYRPNEAQPLVHVKGSPPLGDITGVICERR